MSLGAVDKRDLKNDLAQQHGIDFAADFHELSSAKVEALLVAADSVKYRKPAFAKGSRARCFFNYLNRGAQ